MKPETPMVEQEVTINLYPKQVDEYADVYSSIPAYTQKLRKMVADNPGRTSISNLDPGVVARIPRDWVKIKPPPKRAELTEEQKRKNLENLRAYRESKAKEAGKDGLV